MEHIEPPKYRLDAAARKLLPKGAAVDMFFHRPAQSKNDCLCYTMLKYPQKPEKPGELERQLFLLRRAYGTEFRAVADTGGYDMEYQPYDNDLWGGSQEGLVNQRFSAIRYIEMIVNAEDGKQLKALERRIVALQTRYSVRVISDDLLFQNIYSKMHDILEIDSLLADLRDNERQMAALQNEDIAAFDESANRLLLGISFLALFSALIDAADYFELFAPPLGLAKWLSLGVVALVVIVWALWRRRR